MSGPISVLRKIRGAPSKCIDETVISLDRLEAIAFASERVVDHETLGTLAGTKDQSNDPRLIDREGFFNPLKRKSEHGMDPRCVLAVNWLLPEVRF
jgi:hypothetical protein